ncbi:MAG: DUF928 domain-containing protein [Pleurocapsa sp.]
MKAIRLIKSKEIETKLNNHRDRLTKANIYAEAGLWYDALAEVAATPSDPQVNRTTNSN